MKRRVKIISAAIVFACSIYSQPLVAQKKSSRSPLKAIDDIALRNADSRKGEWVTHGRTYAETRFSPLSQINAGNVKGLALEWIFDTDTTRGLEATPIVADGKLFTTGSWSIVFAIDARTGKELWKWDPKVPGSFGQRACCDVVNRGVAVYKGKVYVGTIDGRLAALDADSGKLLWQVVTVDQKQPYTITGAPRVVKGKVIIGYGGAEFGVRGYVSAYDAETGKLAWRFYTVPGDPSKPFESPALERAAKTWTGEWWKMGGGGTVWDSLAYDPELDLLYVGTGNGSPWNREIRSPGGGDNLYLSSILALKPDTGTLVWHYQTTPGDSWDFTATQHMVLADLEIGGRSRKVLMQAPKNGFFYVIDRQTGELLSAEPYTILSWAKGVDKTTGRPNEDPAARYKTAVNFLQPGPFGGHNWQPMSFNPQTGLVYIPAQEPFFAYAQDKKFVYKPGAWNTGVDLTVLKDPPPLVPRGHLLAWDPIAQKERWRVQYNLMWNGGTLTTAGYLVFQGTSEGRFVAYSADKGEKLWEIAVGTGVIAPPITYEMDGVQYVAVMAGWGGTFPLTGGTALRGASLPGRLLVFSLNGKQKLPEPVAQNPKDVTAIIFDAAPERIEHGAMLFAQWCSMCHGIGALGGGGVVPDLRQSPPATFGRYEQIVLGGAYQSQGMPSFKEWLTVDDVKAIQAYILKRRADLAAKR
jgi:quinohemoprotein ethanol dehydrogenase